MRAKKSDHKERFFIVEQAGETKNFFRNESAKRRAIHITTQIALPEQPFASAVRICESEYNSAGRKGWPPAVW
jgi:hypothetical protein